MEREDGGGAELAAAALVGLGGGGEAVAEDYLAGLECGLDDLGDDLGTIGKHEGHLGLGRKGRGTGVEQQRANAVACGSSAGLTGEDRMVPAFFEPGGQTIDLGGF